jgi:hypothetical protein
VQLARARARMRLDYVLALRRVELPTPRCRPVLLALSMGDRRRQLALDAGGHLMECPTCASLARPLVERKRSIAVLLPLLAVWWLWRRFQAWARRRPVLATLAAGTALTVTGAVVVPPLIQDTPPPRPTVTTRPSGAAPGTTATGGSAGGASSGGGGSAAQPGTGRARITVPGRSLLPVPSRSVLARHAGQAVRGVHVPAYGVFADEGFWAGSGGGDQLWVELVGEGESPFMVRRGDHASFTGRLVRNAPGFADRVGVIPEEGQARLQRQGYHIEVTYADLELEG